MYSKTYATPLKLKLKESRCFFILLVFLHAFAGIVTVFLQLSWIIKIPILLVIAIGFLLALTRHRQLTELIWREENHWELIYRNGIIIQAHLLPSSVINNWFAALSFKTTQSWFPACYFLCADGVEGDDYRRLKVRLQLDKPCHT